MFRDHFFDPEIKKNKTKVTQKAFMLIAGSCLLTISVWLGRLTAILSQENPLWIIVSFVCTLIAWLGIGVLWYVVGPLLRKLMRFLRRKDTTLTSHEP
jgi:uncharacterized membrane protein YbhN (UPF0104 family)